MMVYPAIVITMRIHSSEERNGHFEYSFSLSAPIKQYSFFLIIDMCTSFHRPERENGANATPNAKWIGGVKLLVIINNDKLGIFTVHILQSLCRF